MEGPAAKRAAVAHLQAVMSLSERRACSIVGADRKMVRYRSSRRQDAELRSRLRDELLNETLFFDLDDARAKIANWVTDYNIRRPHSSLKYLTPAVMPPISPQRTIGCATPTSSADRPLLHPRHLA